MYVRPYANAAAFEPSRRCSASTRVGNGLNAMIIRKTTLMKRNVRSTRPICVNTVWWLTQTMPSVRNEIAYAAYDGHSAISWCATEPSPLKVMSRISSVAAIAKTPSLKVSRRAVSFTPSV